jgi:hypothetical protein
MELARRRASLVARSTAQRELLVATADQINARLERIDQRVDAVRRFFQRPWLLLGAIAAVGLLVGPRKLVRIASRGAVWFTATQRVLRLVPRGLLHADGKQPARVD